MLSSLGVRIYKQCLQPLEDGEAFGFNKQLDVEYVLDLPVVSTWIMAACFCSCWDCQTDSD